MIRVSGVERRLWRCKLDSRPSKIDSNRKRVSVDILTGECGVQLGGEELFVCKYVASGERLGKREYSGQVLRSADIEWADVDRQL